MTVLELASLLKKALGLCLSGQVRVRVLVHHTHSLGHVVPVDLELRHSRLLSQDVPGESLDDGGGGRVLVQLSVVVLNVDVVADAQELLAVLVGAGEQDGSHAHDVAHG